MKRDFTMLPTHLPGLAVFECVARNGSFTRAADELGLSTSALSQTVRKLEQALGVRLLNRTSRKVGPTEAGARLLAAVTPAMTTLADACDALQDESDGPRGTVRVSLSRVAHALLIAPYLSRFLLEYPEVRVELGLNDGLSEIVSEGYDLGIRLGERLPRDMVAMPIGGEQELVIVGAPAYFARHPKPRRSADLREHDCIRLRFVSSGRLYRWWLGGAGEESEVDVEGRLVLNDMVEIVDAAVAGLGLAQLFAGLARPHLTARRLVRVLASHSVPFAGFRLYCPSRAQLPLKVRAFVDFFQAANRRGRAV